MVVCNLSIIVIVLSHPTDAGVPVYLYEFQQTTSMFKKMRPSFVGSDHGDELMFVFGLCFTSYFIMDGKGINLNLESIVLHVINPVPQVLHKYSISYNHSPPTTHFFSQVVQRKMNN